MGYRQSDRSASCKKKKTFETWNDALYTANESNKKSEGLLNLSPYKCKKCNKFHISSTYYFDSDTKRNSFSKYY